MFPRTAVVGAISRSPPITSGAPMSPAWMMWSDPARCSIASGRRSPCVSEMMPIRIFGNHSSSRSCRNWHEAQSQVRRSIAQSMEDVPVSISTRYVLIASMDVTPESEALFNEIYDTEHVPNLLQVPGVRSVTRMKGEPARFAIAGSVRELPAPSPIYTAIYEIDDPQVLQSPQWAEAVERGRWPSGVRPHTSNRQHMLFKVQ